MMAVMFLVLLIHRLHILSSVCIGFIFGLKICSSDCLIILIIIIHFLCFRYNSLSWARKVL